MPENIINKVVYGDRTLIDLTEDTVTEDSLVAGFTAHDKSGALIVGALPDGDSLGYGDTTVPMVGVGVLDFTIADGNEEDPTIGNAAVGFAVLEE